MTRTRWTAAELMAERFPEPRWAVPGVIPEGLTIIAGAPKLGKSWWCLGVAVAVATGGLAFGGIRTEQGDVLYLALEDNGRRLQSRLHLVIQDGSAPARLTLETSCGRGVEAVGLISEWLDEHPDARLVVVDVLAKVRPRAARDTSLYDTDYATGSALKALADEYGIAIVVVHHTRKMAAADFIDEVSGSTGLSGSADTVAVLRRSRGEDNATLHITGRDVDEAEYALVNSGGRWLLDGADLSEAAANAHANHAAEGLGETSVDVLRYVAAHPEGVTPAHVADSLGIDNQAAGKYLGRLFDAGRIDKPRRGYYAPSTTGKTGKTGKNDGADLLQFPALDTFPTHLEEGVE